METIKQVINNAIGGASNMAEKAMDQASQAVDQMSMDAKSRDLQQYVVDDSKQGNVITTNWGTHIAETEISLKAGERGPTLMEDFHFIEKMNHFDHERIPERVVHARGAAAHGYFQVYEDQSELCKAGFLKDPTKQTPVFVRFSTVLGSRGAADTAREVRGFATRFYTEEGNWDLVGNNIPIFFVQDAIKFVDLIHAGKPEPHNEIPQAATAHDNFWDWTSRSPEASAMTLWALSDRALPRTFSQMQGFGVHSFILVNAAGKRRFVKFHWTPTVGVNSMVWDESMKLMAADPDFQRRDLYDSIEAGIYPEYELGFQIVEEEDEHKFDFDILDSTKFIPEELVPVRKIGKMVLNRNIQNYFSETEQVAFCTSHLVPGIETSNDPLLQGRHFSYVDTQTLRLGGPNFKEIPINKPICPVTNNQRDAPHRMTINSSHVNYTPNRFGCPAMDKQYGYTHAPVMVHGPKIRAKGPKFYEFHNQAKLFLNSLSEWEVKHITEAAIFELSKVEIMDIRKDMVEYLNKIDHKLACDVAPAIGVEAPKASSAPTHTNKSPAVSQDHFKSTDIKGMKICFLVANGYNSRQINALRAAFKAANATNFVVGPIKGAIKGDATDMENVESQFSFTSSKSVMFDAFVIVGGKASVQAMTHIGGAMAFILEGFKHGKPIIAIDEGIELVDVCNLPGVQLSTGPVVTSEGVVSLRGMTIDEKEPIKFAKDANGAVKSIWDALVARRFPYRNIARIAI